MDINKIQHILKQHNLDGWLFCDFHNRDHISYKILDLDSNKLTTRRWFYLIPAIGKPVKLVHRIESKRLNGLLGNVNQYVGWKELRKKLREMLRKIDCVAMQYSPENNIPTVSLVDGGTIELVRAFGVNVVSSANLIQIFEARVDAKGIESHKEAGKRIHRIKNDTFSLVAEKTSAGKEVSEYEIMQFILDNFKEADMTCDGLNPIVAVNEHAADPHYEVTKAKSKIIKSGDRLLIDLWAKLNKTEGIYYDITWCAFLGDNPPSEYVTLFDIVVNAKNLARDFIKDKIKSEKKVFGWEVDKVCRDYIVKLGYGKYFTHRTGHSIHSQVHGNGVNIDNLETKDDREIIPGACFSIEPGIYKKPFGVRAEVNVVIDEKRNVISFGEEQEGLLLL